LHRRIIGIPLDAAGVASSYRNHYDLVPEVAALG
jgi:hypothetical protein